VIIGTSDSTSSTSDVRDEIAEEITIWVKEVDAHEIDLPFLNEWLRGAAQRQSLPD
jgi:hypothetical protein